jgi:hypothetical protein
VARTSWLLTLGLIGAGLFGWAQLGFRALPVSLGGGPDAVLGMVALAATYSTVGLLIADRRPGNVIAWLFIAVGFGIGSILPVDVLVASAHTVLRPVPQATLLLAWWNSSSNLPIAASLVLAIILLFPTGRPIARRWWAALWAGVGGSALVTIGVGLRPSGLIWFPSLANPFAVPRAEPVLGGLTVAGVMLLLAALGAAITSVVVRFRSADAGLRNQLHWAGTAAIVAGIAAVPALVVRYTPLGAGSGESLVTVAVAGQMLIPLGVGIATLHCHLYDIELLVDRSLVYLPLVGLLGGLYAASVTLVQRLFVTLTGDTSDVAIIVSSLLIAWVFTPLRKLLEGAVERHVRPGPAPAEPAPAATEDEILSLESELQSVRARVARLEMAIGAAA